MFSTLKRCQTSSLTIIITIVTALTVSCGQQAETENSIVYPATYSQISSVSIPVPNELKQFIAEEKINSLHLKITPRSCDEGVVGTNIEKFVPNFGQSNSALANERLRKGCTYSLAISLGKANSSRTGFEKIFLTNDTENLRTTIQVPKTSQEKLRTTVRVYPTNDGKILLGLPQDPVDMGALNTPDPVPQDNNQPSLLPPQNQSGINNQQSLGLNWKFVVMASDQANKGAWIQAFDNARKKFVDYFLARGVAAGNMRQLSLKPQFQSASVQSATTQNFTSTLSTLNATGSDDACMIFMTSHGSRDGFNIGSSRLTPSALRTALNAGCGNRPTVLLVSACYSGLYTLDSSGLKTPNRVILTAARSDRTSFGCSPENEYTYWDGCLLENLPRSTTFRNLATNIQACISRKEAGMSTPSLPQAFIGADVENLKIPGSP